jgi:hypothetical protein
MREAGGSQLPMRILVEAPRWLFLLVLTLAPWMYGATPQWVIMDLVSILAAILVLWLGGCALRKLRPGLPSGLVWCVAVILVYGWAMTLNPHLKDNGNFTFTPIKPLIGWLPGTVDGATSRAIMMRITVLLGTVCFVCDISGRRDWRRRIWRAMALTGTSLVLFGLIQSAFAKPLFLWGEQDIGEPYFATYYYHGNAGSFINLVLPFIAGLAVLTLRRPDAHIDRALWFPGFFICVAGSFVNLSRSATVITACLCVLLLLWQFRGRSRREFLPPRNLRVAYAVLMFGAILALIAFSGWQKPAQKWGMMQSQLNEHNKRVVATQVCMHMLPDVHWHGFGPGTFVLVFPHYSGPWASLIPGIWKYAHDDYLQTIIEWGWLGAIPFAVLFFGAFAQLLIHWRRRRDWSTSDRVLSLITALAMGGVAAHAIVDFPFQILSLQLYAAVCVGFGWGAGKWEGVVVHRGLSMPEED